MPRKPRKDNRVRSKEQGFGDFCPACGRLRDEIPDTAGRRKITCGDFSCMKKLRLESLKIARANSYKTYLRKRALLAGLDPESQSSTGTTGT